MTNDFAVDILKQIKEKPTLINDIDTQEEAVWYFEALDLAIKALGDKGYKQGYKDGYAKGFEEGVVLG